MNEELPDLADVSQLRCQIQFYFSQANLQTDPSLQQQLQKNSRWVPMSYLLKCHRLQHLLQKMKIPRRKWQKTVSTAISQSHKLTIRNGKVRAKNRNRNPQKIRNNLVYLEIEDQQGIAKLENQVREAVGELAEIKSGRDWVIVTGVDVGEMLAKLQLGGVRVVLGDQWEEYHRIYQGLVAKLKKL